MCWLQLKPETCGLMWRMWNCGKRVKVKMKYGNDNVKKYHFQTVISRLNFQFFSSPQFHIRHIKTRPDYASAFNFRPRGT